MRARDALGGEAQPVGERQSPGHNRTVFPSRWLQVPAVVSLLLVGCLTDPGLDDGLDDRADAADAGTAGEADGVALEMAGAGGSYAPLPAQSTPSVGFRATFHSIERPDPDYRERREGGRVDAIQPAGSKVFIGGYFNRAIRRNQTEVTRNALAAMSTSTLDLVTTCNPSLGPAGLYGARVRALALSKDGSTLFVAGRFSNVGGVARENLAAIRVSDCSLLDHFAGWSVNGEIYSLLVDGNALYVGGDFTSIGGANRSHVAKLDVANASVSVASWNPRSSKRVKALALDRTNGRVILVLWTAGTVAGQAGAETIALDRSTGAYAWKANTGDGGMAAVTDASNVYVGVRGVGGRVYAYRLSNGTELFWHFCNGDVQAITMTMLGKLGQSVYHVGLQGNRILFALAELVIGWRLVVNAEVARGKLAGAGEADRAFYQGKLAAARWYARHVLPGIGLTRRLVEAGDLELMDLPDEAF